MKVLMLTPYLPYPPSSGGQVRSYNLIKNLAKKHQITLFSLIKSEEEKKYIFELEKFCREVFVFRRPRKPWTIRNILRTGFGFYPFLVVRNLSSEEKKMVSKKLLEEKFDLIHAETFYTMPHIPETKIPILLVDQTIEFQVYQHYADSSSFWFIKPFLYLDVFKIKFWEVRFWRKATRVVAVSENDKKKMLMLEPNLRVDVVPNGAGEDLLNLWEKRRIDFKKPIVFFQGNFSWLQNTEAARILAKEIFPKIKEKIPKAVCRIAGQGADEKISDLRRGEIEICDLDIFDTEGVKKFYSEATVFVAPLKGPGGTRLKILGAMAAGVPVVTSRVGIEGIEAKEGKEVLLRDEVLEMAEAVVSLIKNPDLYRKLTRNARKLIEEKYSWPKISQKLDKIYQEVGGGERKS